MAWIKLNQKTYEILQRIYKKSSLDCSKIAPKNNLFLKIRTQCAFDKN